MPTYNPPLSSLTGLPIGPGTPPASTLQSGPTQAGKGAFGTVPSIPNPIATAGQAIGGDIGNLAGLYGLTTGTSGASAAGAATQYNANLPLYGQLTQTGSQNILGNLQGQVAPDVVNQLSQLAAQRGVGFGAGAPNSNAALLSALGQTSMGLQNLGQQQLTSAIGRTPVGPAFNPASFLVNPADMQGAQYAANLFGAAPNPAAAANAGLHQAQQGLNAGLGAGGFGGYVGGGGLRDALGFPITPETGYGAGGPPEMAGGALGAPATSNENLAGWNQWWNAGTQGPMTGGQISTMGQGGTDWASMLGEDLTGGDWQTGMQPDQGYGGDFFGGGDVFADIGG